MQRARTIVAAALFLLFTSARAADSPAQANPAKPVRIVVPSAPGGGTDIQARLLENHFQDSLGQPVLIDNRPGGSGMIGAELVVKSPPDGYTLLLTSAHIAVNVNLYKKMPFDPLRDLAPVAQVSLAPQLFAVHLSIPVYGVREFVALAKKHPRNLTGGSSGNGSLNHLSLEMLKQRAGVEVVHRPYPARAAATAALVGGEIDFMFTGIPDALPHVRAHRVRPLAVTSLNRSPVLPDVIAMDAIYPGFEAANWYAVFVPSGTPEAIVARLNKEISRAVQTREVRELITSEGAEPVGGTPQELSAFFRREVERYAKVIKAANVRVE